MNTIRKTLLGMVMGIILMIGLAPTSAHAIRCYLVYDIVRTAWFDTQMRNRLGTLVSEYFIVDAKKKELKLWETRRKFEEDELPQGFYYNYMKNATATGSEAYNPAKSSPEKQEKYVRENMFYDSDLSKLTEAEKQKVINARLSYLEALASEVLSLSAGARNSIAAELSVLKDAKTTAGGEIQQVDLLVHTKKLMVEQKAADILLQAKLLEFDAAQMILGLSPQRVEDPKEKK